MTTLARTVVPAPAPTVASLHVAAPRSSFLRQAGVEARKLVDTRSGFWLLAGGVVLTLAVAALNAFVITELGRLGGEARLTWAGATGSVGSALGMFLGVLAVLTVTSEWSQRTALTTFALEPRRGRVLAAKAVVLVAATVVLVLVAVAVGALTVAITQAMGLASTWELPPRELAGFAGVALLNTAMGAAFGLLFLNTVAGVVAFFGLPLVGSVVSAAGGVWEPLGRIAPWVVPDASSVALLNGTIHGEQWGWLATSTLVWVVLPAAVGTWRWLRRQVV